MKKLISLLLAALLLLTACGKTNDINGTYASKNGSKIFRVIIYEKFCIIDVNSTNENGDTASVSIPGKVISDEDRVVLTIEKESDIKGNEFEFIYNDQTETLTNTSDGSIIKKIKTGKGKPSGVYKTKHDDKVFEIDFDGNKCKLTVIPAENPEQYINPVYNGKVNYKDNIITLEFEEDMLEDDLYKFVYDDFSDILMNTADGHIFEKENLSE